jgi:hypothetical protein
LGRLIIQKEAIIDQLFHGPCTKNISNSYIIIPSRGA